MWKKLCIWGVGSNDEDAQKTWYFIRALNRTRVLPGNNVCVCVCGAGAGAAAGAPAGGSGDS